MEQYLNVCRQGAIMKKQVAAAAQMPPLKGMEIIHEFVRGYHKGGKIYKDGEGKYWLVHGIMTHQVPNELVRSLARKKEKRMGKEPLADGILKQ